MYIPWRTIFHGVAIHKTYPCHFILFLCSFLGAAGSYMGKEYKKGLTLFSVHNACETWLRSWSASILCLWFGLRVFTNHDSRLVRKCNYQQRGGSLPRHSWGQLSCRAARLGGGEGGYITIILCTAIAPIWFSMMHPWIAITPFWLSTDSLPIWHYWKKASKCHGLRSL